MPEDFYAALMMRRALPTTTNIKTITAPGIYPVDAGNANAPGSAAGALIVLPPTSKPKLKFIKESDTNVYTLIGSDWKKPTATDVDAVPATRKVNGHALSSDVDVLPGDIFKLATGIGDAADLNAYTAPGLYYQPANAQASTGKNYPETVAGSLEVYKHAGITQIYRVYNGSRSYIRTLYGSAWSAWTKQYDTANKPTAGDVGAIPLAGSTGVTGIVRSSAELQSSSANSFRIGYGGYGTFWRNDGANLYLMLTNQNDPWGNYNALRPFRVSTNNGEVIIGKLNLSDFGYFDARYQAKGSYTPAGQAYTKAESDARYNLKNTATKATNAMTSKDSSTGVMEVVMSNITVAANTNVSVTFSTAFPSVCVGVVIAYDGAGHGNNSDSSIAVASYTRTGCVLRANNANGKFMLIAKGY
ncbi:pyocin knob domain-containing protein [Enterobacter mori]|uniref:pyocin knob domain-containing protein n=1 Tax=Enterobacter mori TaxID=539813 RepID=UPI001B8D7B7E|nr:pyocin knob domain-containing protein [Enterobacter mori]